MWVLFLLRGFCSPYCPVMGPPSVPGPDPALCKVLGTTTVAAARPAYGTASYAAPMATTAYAAPATYAAPAQGIIQTRT